MCNFTTLINASITQPYSLAGSKYKATWNGELNGKKITYVHRLGQLAAGVLLSIPLVNIIACQIFKLMSHQNPQPKRLQGAQSAQTTPPVPVPAPTPAPTPKPDAQSTPLPAPSKEILVPEPNQPVTPAPTNDDDGMSLDLPPSCSSTPCSSHQITPVIKGNTAKIVNADLSVSVRTTKAEDGHHYAEISLTPSGLIQDADKGNLMDFVFCIDISLSMTLPMNKSSSSQTRLQAVKAALKKFLTIIQESGKLNGEVRLSLVTFNNIGIASQSVTPVTCDTIKTINQKIDLMFAVQGGTSIKNGLESAAFQLNQMVKTDGIASRTLVFLTDGDDEALKAKDLELTQEALLYTSTNLVALGLGADHKADVMQLVIGNHIHGLGVGNYPNALYHWIDDEVQNDMPGKVSLDHAMSLIYAQANQLRLQNVTLKLEGKVSDRARVFNARYGLSLGIEYQLGDIPFNTTVKKMARITHGLEEFSFKVSYAINGARQVQTITVPLTDEINPEVNVEAKKQFVLHVITEAMSNLAKASKLTEKLKIAQTALKRVHQHENEPEVAENIANFKKIYEGLLSKLPGAKIVAPQNQTELNHRSLISLMSIQTSSVTIDSNLATVAGPSSSNQ